MPATSAAPTTGGRISTVPRETVVGRRAELTPSLTGLRAIAALLVIGTHASYGTGMLSHGYLGLTLARLEIGVQIFFVLSGFLLFRPWVRAVAGGWAPPLVGHYARQRVRRIMPAYVATVLVVYLIYQFRSSGPNPGHTWWGLVQHLTLTQIYSDQYIFVLHQGLTQTWSLAVEVAFYAALPVLAHLLLVVLCRGQWRPGLLLAGLAGLAALTPAWLIVLHATDLLPSSAGMWLPAHLLYFVGGMVLAVLQVLTVRCPALIAVPVAVLGYLLVSTSTFGDVSLGPVPLWQPVAKTIVYALIATATVAPLVLGGGRARGPGGYSRLLGSRPMVWLGEISYEIFLLHVVVMEIAMTSVLRWPVFTGSMPVLVVVTLALTVPPAWLLHRWTRPARASAAPADPAGTSPRGCGPRTKSAVAVCGAQVPA